MPWLPPAWFTAVCPNMAALKKCLETSADAKSGDPDSCTYQSVSACGMSVPQATLATNLLPDVIQAAGSYL